MMGADAIIALCALGTTILGALSIVVSYISRQIDKKLSVSDFDTEHRNLMNRVRHLELWAAKKGYRDGAGY